MGYFTGTRRLALLLLLLLLHRNTVVEAPLGVVKGQ